MKCDRIRFTQHAFTRMFEREITPDTVVRIVEIGEVIEEYPDDHPYPSVLLCAQIQAKTLHAVVAYDSVAGDCYIVTVYVPDATLWSDDFRKRR